MATVTKAIKASGGDYTTITLWEADLDNDTPYDAGDDAVGELYDEAYNENTNTIDGGSTLGLNSATLQGASGERHDGTAGTGARIVMTGAGWPILLYNTIDFTLAWFELDGAKAGDVSAGIYDHNASAEVSRFIHHLIVHDLEESSDDYAYSGLRLNNRGAVLTNTIVYDITKTKANSSNDWHGIAMRSAWADTAVLNCVVDRISITDGGSSGDAHGILDTDESSDGHGVRNCISTNTSASGSGSAVDYEPNPASNITMSNNIASDTTASGTDSHDSESSASLFVSVVDGSEDYHLKSGTNAVDGGVDLGTTPTNVNYDIDNRDRDSEGDTWDIGADEYVSIGGGGLLKHPGMSGGMDEMVGGMAA